jgi:hypothetical protein
MKSVGGIGLDAAVVAPLNLFMDRRTGVSAHSQPRNDTSLEPIRRLVDTTSSWHNLFLWSELPQFNNTSMFLAIADSRLSAEWPLSCEHGSCEGSLSEFVPLHLHWQPAIQQFLGPELSPRTFCAIVEVCKRTRPSRWLCKLDNS